MAKVRSTTSQRRRRHADRPRPWTQFPSTLLGMAFITALFLSSHQNGATSSGFEPDVRTPYQESVTP